MNGKCTLRHIFACLCAAATLLVFQVEAWSQVLGTLYSSEGKVEIRRGLKGIWQTADPKCEFGAGDALRTGEGSRAAFVNRQRLLIRVAPNSMIEFTGDPNGVNVDSGTAHFFNRDQNRRPKVTTATVSGAIRGIEFTVTVNAEGSTFSVIEGAVDLENQFGTLALASGEEGFTAPGQAPVKRILVRPFDRVQWTIRYPALVSVDGFEAAFAQGSSSEQKGFQQLRSGHDEEALQTFGTGSSELSKTGQALALARSGNAAAGLSLLNGTKESSSAISRLANAALALETGEVGRAEQIHASLVHIPLPPALEATLLTQRTVLQIARDDLNGAQESSARARAAAPGRADVLFVQSLLEQAQGDVDAARETSRAASAAAPDNGDLLAREAELVFASGDSEEAAELVRRAEAAGASDDDTKALSGFIALARDEVEEARRIFSELVDSGRANASAHLGLGITRFRLGEEDEARFEIQKAAHLDPTNALYRSYLGKAFFESDREHEAETELDLAKKLDPNDPTPYLYEAFNRLALFRPTGALESIEASIARNDSRAVYRSRLLLDQDRATKSTSLGRVYRSLEFFTPARIEAMKSTSDDPSNYSAHFLAGDALSLFDDSDVAVTAERRLALLLAPATFSSLVPAAGGGSGLNDYTTLFEQETGRSVVEVFGQTADPGYQALVSHFGGGDDYSYLAQLQSSYFDGFLEDQWSRSYSGRMLFQKALTPDDKLLVDVVGDDFETGDQRNLPDYSQPSADQDFDFEDVSLKVGHRHSFSSGSHLLSQATYLDRHVNTRDAAIRRSVRLVELDQGREVDSFVDGADFSSFSREHQQGMQGEVQHIWDTAGFSLVTGAEAISLDLTQRNDSFAVTSDSDSFRDLALASRADVDVRQLKGYSYLTLEPVDWVRLTGGSSFTSLDQAATAEAPFVDRDREDSSWDPRGGIMLFPSDYLTVRAAYFEMLGKPTDRARDSIEPTSVSGVQAIYDDEAGARSENYALGVDWKCPGNTYLGSEFVSRHVNTPFTDSADQVSFDPSTGDFSNDVLTAYLPIFQQEQSVTTYVNQILADEWVGIIEHIWTSSDASFSQFDAAADDTQTRTHTVRTGLTYFHPSGFFARSSATYRDQTRYNVESVGQSTDERFWIVNAGVGWQFPHRKGSVQFVLGNILDQNFSYVPTSKDPNLYPGIDGSILFSYNF